jgi:hypothetical protein
MRAALPALPAIGTDGAGGPTSLGCGSAAQPAANKKRAIAFFMDAETSMAGFRFTHLGRSLSDPCGRQ